jgi:predicted RNase H-like nuclease (RuvC/YqgF family)
MTKIAPLFSIFLIGTLTFCTNKSDKELESLKAQISALKTENDSFRNKVRKQESTISGYNHTLEEIDFNLNKIQLNWSLVAELKGELGSSVSVDERIKSRIAYIDKLIGNSQLKIMSMDRNLNELRKASSEQSEEVLALDRALKTAARTLIDKEEEFNRQKKALNLEFEDLEKVYEEQKAFTQELYKMLNRAYFYAGSSKDLKKNKIIDKEGGFVGIGKVKVIKASANELLFNQLEKDKTNRISLSGKKVKILTSHDLGSYTLENEGTGKAIVIMDKKAFWKVGNYLIVQTD